MMGEVEANVKNDQNLNKINIKRFALFLQFCTTKFRKRGSELLIFGIQRTFQHSENLPNSIENA